MKGYPDGAENSVTLVRDTDPDTIELAKTNIARRAHAGGWSYDDIVDVLEHLGLRAPETPGGGKTTPTGRNVSPAVQQRRRETNRVAKQAARAKRKDTP